MWENETSLRGRLNQMVAACVIPFLVITCYLIVMMYQFSVRYDRTVQNITTANEYNLTLKENVDYTMYIIVVNSEHAEELVDVEEPERLVSEALEDFETLYSQAEENTSLYTLKRIIQSLQTLQQSNAEVTEDARQSGSYDRNMERLDLDIRVQTELIQELIQEYINDEAIRLQELNQKISSDVMRAIAITTGLVILVLVITLVLGRRIGNNLVAGIDQLRQVTRRAGRGDFTVRANLEDNDVELAELAEGFNHMVERIGNLVDDIQVEQLNLRTTELKLLQAQINPHFLYNTLDTIIWLAEAEQKEQVIMMVTELSNFFRTTLSKGRDYISVGEEESHIRSYMRIQQFRYQDILEYEIDIPPELHQYQILKLTLQPLVENALYHGIKNKRGLGHIRVSGQMDSGYLVFLVKDDGIGMTPERLKEVQAKIQQEKIDSDSHTGSSGFGLYNVQQRIKLNYGSQYGIWIDSTYGEGTEVRVEIPAVPPEKK